MIVSPQLITILNYFLTFVDWACKLILFSVIILAFKKARSPKEFKINSIFSEMAFNTAALIFLFSFTGSWPQDQSTVLALCFGACLGIITALPIKIYKLDSKFYSQGTNWHIILWAVSLLAIEIFETWDFGIEKQLYLVAICNLAMLYGASFHLLLAYQEQE